jgi:glycosyltransferase involved in cell wall biosynthesis
MPVIVTDVGSCREVAEEGVGIVVPPGDYHKLASSLERLATNEQLWQMYSRRGPELARQFSWESTARVVYSAYEKVLNR